MNCPSLTCKRGVSVIVYAHILELHHEPKKPLLAGAVLLLHSKINNKKLTPAKKSDYV